MVKCIKTIENYGYLRWFKIMMGWRNILWSAKGGKDCFNFHLTFSKEWDFFIWLFGCKFSSIFFVPLYYGIKKYILFSLRDKGFYDGHLTWIYIFGLLVEISWVL